MKKQPLLILSLLALIFCSVVSCKEKCEKGSGNSTSEERKVDAFSKINVSVAYTSVQLVLKQGNASVKLIGDDNLLKMTKTDVGGDELKITTDGTICNAQPLVIEISNPQYQGIKSSGAIDISSDTTLNVKDFSLELSGKSKVNLGLNAANVSISASGSSDITLKGQAAENNVTMNGSGDLNAFDFTVAKYKIQSNGDVNCKINVLSELDVDINGAGQVQYKGNPAKVDKEHSDGTRIKKID